MAEGDEGDDTARLPEVPGIGDCEGGEMSECERHGHMNYDGECPACEVGQRVSETQKGLALPSGPFDPCPYKRGLACLQDGSAFYHWCEDCVQAASPTDDFRDSIKNALAEETLAEEAERN